VGVVVDKKYDDAFPNALLDALLARRRSRMLMFRDEPDCFEVTYQEILALRCMATTTSSLPLHPPVANRTPMMIISSLIPRTHTRCSR